MCICLKDQLVVVELSGVINDDFLSKCCGTCKILDIDSEKPMMQVGPHVFVGEYEDALGTYVLFEEGPPNGDTNDNPELKYQCHTVKRLKMQRIFLTEKKEGETSTGGGDSAGQKETASQSSQDSEEASHQGEAGEQLNKAGKEDITLG
ncbi:general transcription factor 3C polypeptide 6 isoform 2-T2 [Polymixia lowei]